MNTWILLWKIVFIVSMTLFALLAFAVTVGGLKDLRTMFKRLKAKDPDSQKNGKRTS